MKLVLAKWAADRVATGNAPEWVAAEAINYLKTRVDGHGGMILLDARGRIGIAHNTPRMAWAIQDVKTRRAAGSRTKRLRRQVTRFGDNYGVQASLDEKHL